jgi:hypothetical protein
MGYSETHLNSLALTKLSDTSPCDLHEARNREREMSCLKLLNHWLIIIATP